MKADTQRTKIAARIRKLMQVIPSRGATEAEAVAAVARIARLLTLYNISLSEIEIETSEHVRKEERYGQDLSDNLLRVVEVIAKLTDTIAWRRDNVVGFFGTPVDCELAHHLTGIIRNALDLEASLYAARATVREASEQSSIDASSSKSYLATSFQRGMGDRLRERIDQLNDERIARQNGARTTQALIPLKKATRDAAFAQAGIQLTPYARAGIEIDFAAYVEGQAAGASLSLNKPLAR